MRIRSLSGWRDMVPDFIGMLEVSQQSKQRPSYRYRDEYTAGLGKSSLEESQDPCWSNRLNISAASSGHLACPKMAGSVRCASSKWSDDKLRHAWMAG